MVFAGDLRHRGGATSRLAITPQYCLPWLRRIENQVEVRTETLAYLCLLRAGVAMKQIRTLKSKDSALDLMQPPCFYPNWGRVEHERDW